MKKLFILLIVFLSVSVTGQDLRQKLLFDIPSLRVGQSYDFNKYASRVDKTIYGVDLIEEDTDRCIYLYSDVKLMYLFYFHVDKKVGKIYKLVKVKKR